MKIKKLEEEEKRDEIGRRLLGKEFSVSQIAWKVNEIIDILNKLNNKGEL